METTPRININARAAVPTLVGTADQRNIINCGSGGSVSTNSTITMQSSRANVMVPTKDLKVAMMDIYNDGIHVDPDAHESDKVRKIGANLFIQWLKILYRRGKTI